MSKSPRLILNEVRYHFHFRGVVGGRRQNELCSSPPLIPCESLMYDTENEGPRTPHLMLVVLTQIVDALLYPRPAPRSVLGVSVIAEIASVLALSVITETEHACLQSL